MSSQKAKINTLLFYHWDNTLFDSMLLPDELDRSLVIQSILLETSDFPVIITDLETLRTAIFVWSSHRFDVWKHLLETTHYIYNPIENYNRLERETTLLQKTGTGTIKGDGGNDTITYNLADSMEEDSSTTDTIRENVITDIDISSQKENSIVSSGSDSTANTGTDIRAITDINIETNTGSDSTTTNESVTATKTGTDTKTISGSESRSKTGYDETGEGVSAFNEQNVFSDHTRTRTAYHSGDSTTTNTTDSTTFNNSLDTDTDRTETIDFGKETVNDRSINEQFTNGKTATTTYGKTETETGTGTETTAEEKLTTADNHSISSRSGSGTKTGTETHKHEQGNIETRNFADSYTADRHVSGNIGVTTTQDMIKQEREIALFDIIDVIVADYKNEFCIQIY